MHSVWLYRIYRFTDTVWPAVIKFHCYEEWRVTHWAYAQKILIEQSTEPRGTLQCRDIQTAGKELQWRTKNNYSVNFYVFSSEIYILQSEFKNAPKEQPYFFSVRHYKNIRWVIRHVNTQHASTNELQKCVDVIQRSRFLSWQMEVFLKVVHVK